MSGDWIVIGIAAMVIVVIAIGWSVPMGHAVDRRRAWNLWAAGLINDTELRRRLGEAEHEH